MRNARPLLLTFALLAVPALSACDGKPSLPEDKAEKAAFIAKEIQKAPDEYEEILKKYEMNADAFEALMYEIAEDPALSDKYAAALGK